MAEKPPLALRPDAAGIDPELYLRERYRVPASRRRVLNAYYALKPFLPRRLQIAARRLYAKRAAPSFPSWPIEPLLVDHQHACIRETLRRTSSARLPLVGFWPDGLRFAVIMTHDVESSAGVANIEAVLEVERRYDIVSSWNFVADWYPIAPGTFEVIRNAGGEVGLHGIKHDGLLFRDRASFESNLPAIHQCLRDWDAVGFRSPALHRNADWMAELGSLYDSSFPDTDPYEPEPGGCCSIFPYFLGEIVELPITMVQDHTLWEILRQPNIDLWRRKGDWVIANHGLINIIVHPDYVRSRQRLDLYAQLLAYLREQIDQQSGWHALPREIASWWKSRAHLRVVDGQDGAPAIDGAAAGEWLRRAVVAWAVDRDGDVTIAA
jgi:peptidoglycan/xylan/chitin deacetylase (PgdA/CDA1 family)